MSRNDVIGQSLAPDGRLLRQGCDAVLLMLDFCAADRMGGGEQGG
jgi:hypothetical protein